VAPDEGGGAAVALDTADPRYRPYLAGVKRRIWECWDVPAPPRGGSVRGTLVVEFTLTRSGRVDAAAVSDPSGVPAFDRAALEAVARAGPYPPLPASIAGSALRVRARFVYD
jgi:protein TonB